MVEDKMEKITKRKTILLLGITLLFIAPKTFSYTGNVISSGAFLTNATQNSEIREMVELTKIGNLLVGKPEYSSIKLVAISAPNIKQGQIIIRELIPTNGKTSLFLSAPKLLEDNTKRVSLFFDQKFNGNILLEAKENTWIEHQALPLQVFDGQDSSTQKSLIAFSTQTFGAYWLIKKKFNESSNIYSNEFNVSANSLLGGGAHRSYMALGLALALLSIGWKISNWQHTRLPK